MIEQPAPARRRGGRPPQLSRRDVITAAITVIDAEGLAALTMRRLATELGVTAMSLYRHVPNRDALLSAVVDMLAAAAITDLDDGWSWRRAVQEFAGGYRAMLLRHPRAVPLLATHPVTIETGLALIDGVLRRFDAAGIGRDQALTVVQSVTVYTLGHALAQVGAPSEDDVPAGPVASTADYYQQWYEAGLQAMVDGFHQRLAA